MLRWGVAVSPDPAPTSSPVGQNTLLTRASAPMEQGGHEDLLGRHIDFVKDAIVTYAQTENRSSRDRERLDIEPGSGVEGGLFQEPQGRENAIGRAHVCTPV